jgi:hypothetical protein
MELFTFFIYLYYMVSPNLFLKLNISFNIIIGLLIIYFNIYRSNCKLITNIVGLLFIYISINNIIIVRQKSAPRLKKDILRTNTLLYCIIGLFILINIKKNKKITNDITLIILNFFALILNFIGYRITKI